MATFFQSLDFLDILISVIDNFTNISRKCSYAEFLFFQGTEFWDSGKTLKEIVENNWFDDSAVKSEEQSTKVRILFISLYLSRSLASSICYQLY